MKKHQTSTLDSDIKRVEALFATGQAEKALTLLGEIVRLHPKNPGVYVIYGSYLHRLSRPEEAIKAYRKALKIKPSFWQAQGKLGELFMALGRYCEATECFERVTRLEPAFVPGYVHLAESLASQTRVEQAIAALDRVPSSAPEFSAILRLKAIYQQRSGLAKEAVDTFRMLAERMPSDPSVLNDLATALIRANELQEAESIYKKALALADAPALVFRNYVSLLLKCGRMEEAQAKADEVLEKFPQNPDAYISQFNVSAAAFDLDAANAHYRQAMRYGRETLLEYKKRSDSISTQDSGADTDPDPLERFVKFWDEQLADCQWATYEFNKNRLSCALKPMLETASIRGFAPFLSLRFPLTNEVSRALSREAARLAVEAATKAGIPAFDCSGLTQENAIRVGYLSADFRSHAVGHLVRQMFRYFDRNRFKIYLYNLYYGRNGEIGSEILESADVFRDLSNLAAGEAVRTIRSDRIHILVDLNGYTKHSRTEIVAARCAPIQINHMGYPGSMGADFIDYAVGTSTLIPAEHEEFYSEKIIRLPHTHNFVSAMPEPRGGLTRTQFGLPEEGFVYASFNGAHKIDPQVFALWMRILKRVPNAVLWQLSDTPMVRRNLRKEAQLHGVDPQRLIFADTVPPQDHIDRLALADLYLDTTVYSAFTTLAMTLWAGLPVIAMLGDRYSTRMGAVAVQAAGLGDLVVSDLNRYEELAVALAEDPLRLKGYRQHLLDHGRESALFDRQGWIEAMQTAFERVWSRYLNGEAPDHLTIPAG